MRTLVLDNGGYQIKAGFVGQECHKIMNALARSQDRRIWMANDVLECKDYSGLIFRRPVDKGQLYAWDLEKAIWDTVFEHTLADPHPVDPSETTLIATEAPFTLANLTINMDQIVFEEYEFARYRRCVPQSLAVWSTPEGPRDCCLCIDIGFNSTQVVPVIRGSAYIEGARRLDVGGKLLTNLYKEMISFRHYNMMEETYIVNAIKESTCYVAPDFKEELIKWRSDRGSFQTAYLLPEYNSPDRLGRLVESAEDLRNLKKSGDLQVLVLSNERFTVPEALFQPAIVGLDQAGIPELVQQCINLCPESTRHLLWANIAVTGGSSVLPGLEARLKKELASLVPQDGRLQLSVLEDPAKYAWRGGCNLALSERLDELTISKEEYDEVGRSIFTRKFGKN